MYRTRKCAFSKLPRKTAVFRGSLMRKISTVLIAIASAAALLTITACKELFADIEEDFSYWASEPVITGFRSASPASVNAAGVQCVPSASPAVLTFTVRNPKNFSFIMPDTPGSPSDIISFGSGIHDSSGTNPPAFTADYTLVQSDRDTLTLTYKSAFLKRYEHGNGNIGAAITLYSTDGRKFRQTYSFNLEANTPPPQAYRRSCTDKYGFSDLRFMSASSRHGFIAYRRTSPRGHCTD